MKRLKEFIWYHINGDGDCNGQVLRAYAEQHELTKQDIFDLAYFYATTYCCASAIFLLDHRNEIISDLRQFAGKYKKRLIFQSDRKYVRMKDHFEKMLATWANVLRKIEPEFADSFVRDETINTRAALKCVENWYFFKRFSAYLFIETYCDIYGIEASRAYDLDLEGDAMTFVGGLFYVFGMDQEAEYVQKYHRLPVDIETINCLIQDLQNEVYAAGGDDNFTKLETSLCAYEKFFKGTRYNGYYADRMLQELTTLKTDPAMASAVQEVFKARKEAIPAIYRGEDNGWQGIRTEQKKRYKQSGQISGYTAETL